MLGLGEHVYSLMKLSMATQSTFIQNMLLQEMRAERNVQKSQKAQVINSSHGKFLKKSGTKLKPPSHTFLVTSDKIGH